MPKDFGPKQVAKKLKAAGLQKLRWYCQVCEKQCRDENGYRNHIQSESHQRKILVVAENPGRQIEDYSMQFKEGFLAILSRRHASKRIFANQVYQEYIADRNHIHMNSTRWATLAEFVLYLGRNGICRIDNTERGWYIEWIDTSPRELARKEAILKMERMKKDQDERDRLLIEEQIERGKSSAASTAHHVPNQVQELKREDGGKISISLSKPLTTLKSNASSSASNRRNLFQNALDDEDEDD